MLKGEAAQFGDPKETWVPCLEIYTNIYNCNIKKSVIFAKTLK